MAKKKRLLSILSGFERARLKPIEINIDVNFTNVLRAHFWTKFLRQKIQSFVLALRLFGAKILYEKHVCKMLMKLTVGIICKVLRYVKRLVL